MKFSDLNAEEEWNINWKEILENPDGSINVERLKKELYDFSVLIDDTIDAIEDYLQVREEFREECFREDNECKCGLEYKNES